MAIFWAGSEADYFPLHSKVSIFYWHIDKSQLFKTLIHDEILILIKKTAKFKHDQSSQKFWSQLSYFYNELSTHLGFKLLMMHALKIKERAKIGFLQLTGNHNKNGMRRVGWFDSRRRHNRLDGNLILVEFGLWRVRYEFMRCMNLNFTLHNPLILHLDRCILLPLTFMARIWKWSVFCFVVLWGDGGVKTNNKSCTVQSLNLQAWVTNPIPSSICSQPFHI